jgi:hypothetical protein
MQEVLEQKPAVFLDRRRQPGARPDGPERRQFTNSHGSERPEVVEMAETIDRYKLLHRRRFITYDELYDVITGLGYRKP